jgi:hypothetical protein
MLTFSSNFASLRIWSAVATGSKRLDDAARRIGKKSFILVGKSAAVAIVFGHKN